MCVLLIQRTHKEANKDVLPLLTQSFEESVLDFCFCGTELGRWISGQAVLDTDGVEAQIDINKG
jgi:hypothetical protein